MEEDEVVQMKKSEYMKAILDAEERGRARGKASENSAAPGRIAVIAVGVAVVTHVVFRLVGFCG